MFRHARYIGLIALAALAFAGCNSKPQLRVSNGMANLGADKPSINFTLGPSDGSTLTVNNVLPGTYSSFVEIPEGTVRLHVVVSGGGSNPPDTTFNASGSTKYTVVVIAGPVTPIYRIDTD